MTALQKQRAEYGAKVQEFATNMLTQMISNEDALREAIGRVGIAYRAAAAADPDLYDCSPQSIVKAIAMSALTGLMPGGPMPDVYLHRQSGELEWSVSYRGLVKMGSRDGTMLQAVPVFVSDEFTIERGLNPNIIHLPDPSGDRTFDALVGVYVVAIRPNGHKVFEYMSVEDVKKRRAISRSWNGRRQNMSPWHNWPVEMALKTGYRYAIQRGLVPIHDTMTAVLQYEDKYNHDVVDVQHRPQQAIPARPPAPRLRGALGMDALDGLADAMNQEPAPAKPATTREPGDETENT